MLVTVFLFQGQSVYECYKCQYPSTQKWGSQLNFFASLNYREKNCTQFHGTRTSKSCTDLCREARQNDTFTGLMVSKSMWVSEEKPILLSSRTKVGSWSLITSCNPPPPYHHPTALPHGAFGLLVLAIRY